jgi:hypothetical protein
MEPERILARAGAWKRKTHRLSLDLRLKSVSEAKKFVREHGAVLWNTKAELPNLLDATLGRVARGKERVSGKTAENCSLLRDQLLGDAEFVECRFFRRRGTVLHQDILPFVAWFARRNKQRVIQEGGASGEARRLARFLDREGPIDSDKVRRALRWNGANDSRKLARARRELEDLLVILPRPDSNGDAGRSLLDFWEASMPRPAPRTDQLSEQDAGWGLLNAILDSCVLVLEKDLDKWFPWCDETPREWLERPACSRKFLRIDHHKQNWIVSRKVLERP